MVSIPPLLPDMEFVEVKGGCFQMGSDRGEKNESPAHEVCVDSFYLGKYEVTQGQWKKVMNENPSKNKQCGYDCPVENISWNDVERFINNLNNGNTVYRLPTEAEWEFACRSGGKDEKYCGGDHLAELAWYHQNSENKTHSVGRKRPNGLGIYDMSGNVWEWTKDIYGKEFYAENIKDNPEGESAGKTRSTRGGSVIALEKYQRSTYRNYNSGGDKPYPFMGFRLLKEIPKKAE